jgi:hypothetical protein
MAAVGAMAVAFAAGSGLAAQRGLPIDPQQLETVLGGRGLAQSAANFPCAAYSRVSFQDVLPTTSLDPARTKKAQELEARSVAASLKLNPAVIDRFVATYQAARSGMDAECVQRQVEALTAPRGGPRGPTASVVQSLPDEWKTNLEAMFKEFLSASDSAMAAAALGLFRPGPRWDRLVDTIAEFNLPDNRQAAALAAIHSYVVAVDAMTSGPQVSPQAQTLEQESKARLDRELSLVLTPAQAELWAARTTLAIAGNRQFFQSAVPGVTVSGRLINPAAATAARSPQPSPAISARGGAPANNLSFLGGVRGTTDVTLLPVEPEIIPEDERGGRGRGGRGGNTLGAQNNNRNPLRIEVQDNGAFQISGVPPGRYRVMANANVDTVRLTAAQYIDVQSNNIGPLNLTLRPGLEVRGQIYFAAGETIPETFTATLIPLRLTPTAPRGNFNVPTTNAASDLSFRFTGLMQTPYRLDFGGRGNAGALYLIRAAYGSADPLKTPVQFTGGSEVLKLEVGFATGRVQGIAMNQNAPSPSATIVLAPRDRWRRDLYRSTTAGDDGQFSFEPVAPGEYKVLAWNNSQVGYGDPAYAANIEAMGQSIRVEKTGAASARVQVILE